MICTHPPYANIINYSDNIKEDLSLPKVDDFLKQMDSVASKCYRVLKFGKFCAILMGDARNKGCVVPISFRVMEIFRNAGFTLKEIIIKE